MGINPRSPQVPLEPYFGSRAVAEATNVGVDAERGVFYEQVS